MAAEKKRVLVVGECPDDNELKTLASCGYDIDTAVSVRDAAKKMSRYIYDRIIGEPEMVRLAVGTVTPRISPIDQAPDDVDWQMMLADIVANSTEANLAYLDPSFNFVWVNSAYADRFGYSRNDLQGRNYLELFPSADDADIFEWVRDTGLTYTAKERPFIDSKRPGSEESYWNWTLVPMRHRSDPIGTTRGFALTLVDVTHDVRARREIERLRERAEKQAREMSAVFEALTDAVIVYDANGEIIYANEAAQKTYGVKPATVRKEEMMKRLTVRKPDGQLTQNQDLPSNRAVRGETVVNERFTFRSVEENDLIVLASASPLFSRGKVTGAVAVWHNITEQQKAEDALRISEARLNALFSESPVATALLDDHLNFVKINPFAADLLRVTVENAVGKPLHEVLHESNQGLESRLARVVEIGKPEMNVELSIKPADSRNEGADLLCSYFPISTEDGKIWGVGIMALDVTELKRSQQREHELEIQQREFYRRTILAATGGKLLITEPDIIGEIAGPPLKEWSISEPNNLTSVREEAMQIVESTGIELEKGFGFLSCLGEATSNAIKHAGGGKASIHKTEDGYLFVVSDHGRGIETLNLPDLALVKGYSTTGTLGMGYKMIISCSDKVYLATGPEGTTVAFEMKCA